MSYYGNVPNAGEINGSSFSGSLPISVSERSIYSSVNGVEFEITHDMIKYAALIALGPIAVTSIGNAKTVVYGAKYRFELIDGKTGVITCSTEVTGMVEHILF